MKTKSIIIFLVSICLFSACSEEDVMQTGAEDKDMNRVQLRVPTTVGKDLHTQLQGEWSRRDLQIGDGLTLEGMANQYMRITEDTMYLYSLSMVEEYGLGANNRYIGISDFDTIPYTFEEPNLLIAEVDTFKVYEGDNDSFYYLLGDQRNFKLLPFFFNKSGCPEDVEYKVMPNTDASHGNY